VENAPLSVLEAMACARPVIAAAVGGIPEWVKDGATGFTFAPGDDAELAARIGDLAADAPLRRAMADRGRRFVADFGLETHLDRLGDVFASVLGDPSRNRPAR
jgi:glycosyltransferase involved in cell wall biosynthesis